MIAIQGIEGSNHYILAKKIFGEAMPLRFCLSFDEMIQSIQNGECSSGIMAIENTIAGSILPNYALIDANDMEIIAEEYLVIHHHLMALGGGGISAIEEVCSHPMALLQCKEYFKKYPSIKLVEGKDTALVAKQIARDQKKGVAAIAPKEAATLFGLQIVSDAIQTIKNNETRFVVIAPKDAQRKKETCNKASLKFTLDHKRGSLATILNVFSDCKLNLTKIQSLPIQDSLWKYAFFADLTFEDYEEYRKAKGVLEILSSECKILGEYKNKRHD